MWPGTADSLWKTAHFLRESTACRTETQVRRTGSVFVESAKQVNNWSITYPDTALELDTV